MGGEKSLLPLPLGEGAGGREAHTDRWKLMAERRTTFEHRALPVLLIAPQLLLTAIFFLWPATDAVLSSVRSEDPFGLSAVFVGLANYAALFADRLYGEAAIRTVLFCAAVTAISMGVALALAIQADRAVRGRAAYRAMLVWPYAVAPAIAGVVWMLLLHPAIGLIGRPLNRSFLHWDYLIDGRQALLTVVLASAWKQVSYNFLFLLAGLQTVPRAVLEAARMDGARGWRMLTAITLPLLSPTILFLLAVNLVYAAFDTFATVAALTKGGPGRATETLVVKVYRDGILNQDLGGSSAESVLLMIGVVALTLLQFRVAGRRGA